MIKLAALAALAVVPAVLGQGMSVNSPQANATLTAGSPSTISWDSWPGEDGTPLVEAYFWITAPNPEGVRAVNIGPDGIGRRLGPDDKATPVPVDQGSLRWTPNYTDFMTARDDQAIQVRMLVTSGDMRDHEFVGAKGNSFLTRPLMLVGASDDLAGVNASITETNTMPVTTDERGGRIQHQVDADVHKGGTVDVGSRNAAVRTGASAVALSLAFGAAAAVAVVV